MPSQELETVLQLLRSRPFLQGEDFEEMRAGMEASSGILPLPDDVRAESVDAGGVPGEWITVPESSPDRTILYLHGGG
jgi:acetyl esterase/lipase